MDLLEHAAVTDVIVTSVVLEEARARNASVYQRLRQLVASEAKRFFVFANEHHRRAACLHSCMLLVCSAAVPERSTSCARLSASLPMPAQDPVYLPVCSCQPPCVHVPDGHCACACARVCRDTYVQQEAGESPNDRNDRAIRVAAAWYTARLPGQKIILLTDDADNRRKAGDMGVEALGSAVYAKQRAAEQPELQDLVTAAAAARDEAGPSGAAADGPGASVCVA
jgi:hypothetical protein